MFFKLERERLNQIWEGERERERERERSERNQKMRMGMGPGHGIIIFVFNCYSCYAFLQGITIYIAVL